MSLVLQGVQWVLLGTVGLMAFTTVIFLASEVIYWTLHLLQRLFGPRR